LHQVADLFELNVKLRCQKVNLAGRSTTSPTEETLIYQLPQS